VLRYSFRTGCEYDATRELFTALVLDESHNRQAGVSFSHRWEVVQLAVQQILDLLILVRVQASQPHFETKLLV
jgi:hypothetical protein